MQEPQNNTGENVENRQKPKFQGKGKVSTRIFRLLLEYRDSRLFQWVKKNYVLSMALVALWGMFIVGMFLWFVVSNVIKNTPVQ